jgi:hypothetical protein
VRITIFASSCEHETHIHQGFNDIHISCLNAFLSRERDLSSEYSSGRLMLFGSDIWQTIDIPTSLPRTAIEKMFYAVGDNVKISFYNHEVRF